MLQSGLFRLSGSISPATPSYQFYMIYPVDMCNPYLWPALQTTNASLTGSTLTTVGLSGQVFNNCSSVAGTFNSGGIWVTGTTPLDHGTTPRAHPAGHAHNTPRPNAPETSGASTHHALLRRDYVLDHG